MSLAKGLILVGLAIGGYLVYTKFVANKSPTLPQTQQQANETQVSNLGLDPVKGVGSVVLGAIGNASVSDSAIKDFVSTHDYGVFTKAAQQQTTIVPQFANRAAATAYYASHR